MGDRHRPAARDDREAAARIGPEHRLPRTDPALRLLRTDHRRAARQRRLRDRQDRSGRNHPQRRRRPLRASRRTYGEAARLEPSRIDGLVVAIGELVGNSIEHGAGHGTLSWWTSPGRAVAEIHDPGHLGAVTPGLRRPDALAPRGRGVWLARQFSDVLHLWTSWDGTHARLEIAA
ncbi:MAG TPA: ATP-binding protein [Actinomycetospora sp.]|uniref:ATP-binding protein n=1 Tax=Actinomycetospora sp. TaxID=1872135 RepID=UPI002F45871B